MKKSPLIAIVVLIALGLPGAAQGAPKPRASNNYTILPPFLSALARGTCGTAQCQWSDGTTARTVESADTSGQLTTNASVTSPDGGNLPALNTRTVYSEASLYTEGRIGALTRPRALVEIEQHSKSTSNGGPGACSGRAETWGDVIVTASDGRLSGQISFWSSQSATVPYGPPHETGGSGVLEIALGPTCDGCWESSPAGTATVSFEMSSVARMGQGCSGTASADMQFQVKSIRFVSY